MMRKTDEKEPQRELRSSDSGLFLYKALMKVRIPFKYSKHKRHRI